MKKFLPILFFLATLGFSDSKTDTTIVPKKATGKILFNTQGTEKMQLSNSGSLGIGKTPSRRLDVAITNAIMWHLLEMQVMKPIKVLHTE